MFNGSNNGYSLADIAAATGNNNNDGFGNGGWFLWFIIIIVLLWGNNGWGGYGYGNGGVNSGAADNYVLASDFATIQRQLSDGFNSMERKGDTINAGLCDGFYAQNTTLLNGFNGVNAAITQATINDMQNTNALTAQITGIGNQIAQCCCDNKQALMQAEYNAQSRNCATNTLINTTTRDLVDVENANTRAILDKLCQMEVAAKDDKIADLTAQVNALNLAASQQAQNNYLVDKLSPPIPIPAFQVAPPFAYSGCGCNCNTGCGC